MDDPRGAATFHTPAEAYDRHVGRYTRELGRELIAAAGVRPGQSALDVGCGPGALTAELRALLGGERVAAVDPSAPFVAACRATTAWGAAEVAGAEQLPFEDDAFDCALAQLVVNFMTDPAAGVREMSRVTRRRDGRGRRVGLRGRDDAAAPFWDAAVALDPAAADRDEGRSMPHCAPGELELLLSQARPA